MNAYSTPLTYSVLLGMSAGKTDPGLSIVPVPDAVSREDLHLFSAGRTRENSRVITGDFQAPSLTCDAFTTTSCTYPNQPGHRSVTLIYDWSLSSGKSRAQLHHIGHSEGH